MATVSMVRYECHISADVTLMLELLLIPHGKQPPHGQRTPSVATSERESCSDKQSLLSLPLKPALENSEIGNSSRSGKKKGKGKASKKKQQNFPASSSIGKTLARMEPVKADVAGQTAIEPTEDDATSQPLTELVEADGVVLLSVPESTYADKRVQLATRASQVEKTIGMASHFEMDFLNHSPTTLEKPQIAHQFNTDFQPVIQVTVNNRSVECEPSVIKAPENDAARSNSSHTGSNLFDTSAYIRITERFVTHLWWLVIATTRALLFHLVSVLWAPICSILVVVLGFFIVLRLVCSVSLVNPWLTICHPVSQSPICSIPNAYKFVVYCDPPSGPAPVHNGSAYVDITNQFTKIYNASAGGANLPEALAHQAGVIAPFEKLIRSSRLHCKAELWPLVDNLYHQLHQGSLDLDLLIEDVSDASHELYYSVAVLCTDLGLHSRAPFKIYFIDPITYFFTGNWPSPEADFEDYRDDWINFFNSVIRQSQHVLDKVHKISELLKDAKALVPQIQSLVNDEYKKREDTIRKQQESRWAHLFPQYWDIDDLVKEIHFLNDLDDCSTSCSSLVSHLLVGLQKLQASARYLIKSLELPQKGEKISLSLKTQISKVKEAQTMLLIAKNAAMEERHRFSEEYQAKTRAIREEQVEKERQEQEEKKKRRQQWK